MQKFEFKWSQEAYQAPEVEVFYLAQGLSVLEEVSLGADIEDFEDGYDI